MSSPDADFSWQGGSWIPQATQSSQTLFSSYQLYDPWSTVERAKCDAQFGQIPLWEGLNLQALWCSILPMVSSTLYLLCLALLLSMFLSLLIAWTPLNSGFQLTLLF